MDNDTLAAKIQDLRARLAEIADERQALPSDDFAKRAELLDEEHTLQAKLGELQDEAAEEGAGLAQREAGEASDYERVPDIPSEDDDLDSLEAPTG